MQLQTIHKKDFFELRNDFIDKNLHQIEDHFNMLIDTCEEIMISFWKIQTVDSAGLLLMSSLYERAASQGKSILFSGCQRINVKTHFRHSKLYFEFKNDID